MKKASIFTFTIICLFFSCQQAEKKKVETQPKVTFDASVETDAIMKVIENETKCFFDGNYDCWANNWSHENYAMQAWNNDDGTFDAAIGLI
ncbi:MAG: hypothetical protein IT262_01110 [Saprospiraceae bacterium]|nr:hypothetical protein [Saprospiraceae bacterium]